jgi:hypothetical protein
MRWIAVLRAAAPAAEANRMQLFLFGMQNRTLSPYLAAPAAEAGEGVSLPSL